MIKKRELLPLLDNVITGFARLTEKCTTLEIVDNSVASKLLKKEFNEIVDTKVKALKDAIYATRSEIIHRPRRKDGRANNPGRPASEARNGFRSTEVTEEEEEKF